MSLWSKFTAWIDKGLPFAFDQQILAYGPMALALLVFGPRSPVFYATAAFWVAVMGLLIWRLWISARRHFKVDRLIWKSMRRRFEAGKGLPKIKTGRK